jgi:hypothetical protein
MVRSRSQRAVLGAIIGLLVGAAPAAAATRTSARIYEPFTASGAPSVHVAQTHRGSCFSGSAASGRKDTWRCISRNLIYDPCFSSPKVPFVLCPSGPGSTSAIKIKLTKRLPAGFANKGKPSTSGLPWALQTVSGANCVLATGATNVVDRRRLNFFCGKRRNVLWGDPIRRTEPWMIFSAPADAKRLTRKVAIKTAWF